MIIKCTLNNEDLEERKRTGLKRFRIGSNGGLSWNTVMNLRVPQKAKNLLVRCATIRFSRRTPFHGISRD
jgi:hypothetical protein